MMMPRVTSDEVLEFVAALTQPRRDDDGDPVPGYLGSASLADCLKHVATLAEHELQAEENGKQRDFASSEHDKEIQARGTGPAPVGQYN